MPLPPISPTGVSTPLIYPTQTSAGLGLTAAFNAIPGSINAPIMFEPPAAFTGGRRQLLIIATGQSPDWGGCEVHSSIDDTTYFSAGSIPRGAVQGTLTAFLFSGADPDTGNTLSVDVGMSRGVIIAGTAQDADDYLSLAYVDGEIVGYSAATLTGANAYDLGTYLRRGVYNTPIGSHAILTNFALLNNGIYVEEYPKHLIGQLIYLKFPSFNQLGGRLEDIASLPAYTHLLTGAGDGFSVRLIPQGSTTTINQTTDYSLEVVTGSLAPTTINGPIGTRFTGERYEVKDKNNNAGTYPVNFVPHAPETVDGAASFAMNMSNGGVVLTWDSLEWSVS